MPISKVSNEQALNIANQIMTVKKQEGLKSFNSLAKVLNQRYPELKPFNSTTWTYAKISHVLNRRDRINRNSTAHEKSTSTVVFGLIREIADSNLSEVTKTNLIRRVLN